MWKPAEVVDKHKRRATALWIVLLLAISAYTVRLLVNAFHQRANPSTSLTLTNDRYSFPDVTVCFSESAGCDAFDFDEGNFGEDCAFSALGISSFFYNLEAEDDRIWNATLNEFYYGCVDFNLSYISVAEGEQSRTDTTTATIVMLWTVAETADDEDEVYREVVYVFLDDSAAISIPYSRIYDVNDTVVDVDRSAMAIGKTEKSYLTRGKERFYNPTTVATTSTRFSFGDGLNVAVGGALILDITQAFFSNTIIEEINPFEPLELVGNVGGFWEILVLMWGLFFIASSKPEPDQKARNFVKSYRKGVSGITRTKSAPSIVEGKNEDDEAHPPWDVAHSSRRSSSQETSGQDDEFSAKQFTRPVLLSGPKSHGPISRMMSPV